MHEEAATEWKDVALQAIADDPSRMRVFPLLPRHGISLGAFDADEDFGCLWNAMRIAKSFPETWRRTPLSARRRILKRWREGPIPIEAQSLGFQRIMLLRDWGAQGEVAFLGVGDGAYEAVVFDVDGVCACVELSDVGHVIAHELAHVYHGDHPGDTVPPEDGGELDGGPWWCRGIEVRVQATLKAWGFMELGRVSRAKRLPAEELEETWPLLVAAGIDSIEALLTAVRRLDLGKHIQKGGGIPQQVMQAVLLDHLETASPGDPVGYLEELKARNSPSEHHKETVYCPSCGSEMEISLEFGEPWPTIETYVLRCSEPACGHVARTPAAELAKAEAEKGDRREK